MWTWIHRARSVTSRINAQVITRRRALQVGLAAVGAVGLGGCDAIGHGAGTHSMSAGSPAGSPTGPPTSVVPVPVPPAGPELTRPAVVASTAGVLAVTMEPAQAVVDIGVGHPVTTYAYGGTVPGPTWEVRAGDVLQVRLANRLPALPSNEGMVHMYRPHQWTTTNLHTHGLHVSPVGNGDNPFVSVDPGNDFDYRIELPTDHSAGLYWYHPHRHGAVCQQLRGGMAGAIIVRGDIDEVPEIRAAQERLLFLQAIELGADFTLQDPIPEPTKSQSFFPRSQIFWTVNGAMNPTITMHPGEVQRWRIANAAEGKLAGLSLDGHRFNTIAWDGLTLPAPVASDTVELSPANRVDVLVKAGAPGTYLLRLDPGSSQHPNMVDPGMATPADSTSSQELQPRTVATVVVTGTGPDMALPTDLPAFDPPMLPIARSRTVRYTVARDDSGEFISFGIDDKPFDDADPPYRIPLGTAEEWTVVNDSDDQHVHSFHIHVNPFKVTAVNGVPLAQPQWWDTYLLPATRGESFTFQSNFVDFAGKFVEHCHIVSHEDLGMMESIEVVAP
jgi:FtsP/CotA-like multicopper oxidase with cupredoxin domain